MESRASLLLGKYSTTELYRQPQRGAFPDQLRKTVANGWTSLYHRTFTKSNGNIFLNRARLPGSFSSSITLLFRRKGAAAVEVGCGVFN